MSSSRSLPFSPSTPPSPLVRRPRQERDHEAGTDPEEQEEEGPSPEAHRRKIEGREKKEKKKRKK